MSLTINCPRCDEDEEDLVAKVQTMCGTTTASNTHSKETAHDELVVAPDE